MSKLNFLVFLQTCSDSGSNNPSLNNFKWTRDISGLLVKNPLSESISLAPGESKDIFNGTRTLSSDNTTAYDLSLKPLSSSTYKLLHSAGTAPNFRTPRSIAIDATSEITVSVNGPISTFTATGGTLMNTTAIVVGDQVKVGDQFNQLNQGTFKVISKTSTSFTVENKSAIAEGPITLGVTFANQIAICSASGVQVGDTLVISSGFSPASYGSYKITDVAANYVEFYSTSVLPQESSVLNPSITIYSAAKTMVYVETDQKVSVIVNGSIINPLEPNIAGSTKSPGIFMLNSTIYSLQIANNGLNSASLFIASVE